MLRHHGFATHASIGAAFEVDAAAVKPRWAAKWLDAIGLNPGTVHALRSSAKGRQRERRSRALRRGSEGVYWARRRQS